MLGATFASSCFARGHPGVLGIRRAWSFVSRALFMTVARLGGGPPAMIAWAGRTPSDVAGRAQLSPEGEQPPPRPLTAPGKS